MLFHSTSHLHLYVNSNAIEARLLSIRGVRRVVEPLATVEWNALASSSSLPWFDRLGSRTRRLSVHVGSALLYMASFPRPVGLADVDREKVGVAMMHERFGLQQNEWIVKVDAPLINQTSQVTVALKTTVVDSLHQFAARSGLHVQSIRPIVFDVLRNLQAATKRGAVLSAISEAARSGLVLTEDDAMTTLVASTAGYEVASCRLIAAGSDEAATEYRRLIIGHGLHTDNHIRLAACTPLTMVNDRQRCFGKAPRADFLDRFVL